MALASLLAGCESDVFLAGQRFETREPLEVSEAAALGESVTLAEAAGNRTAPISLGGTVSNAEWSHRGGSASRAMPHLALAAQPQLRWSGTIGAGENRRRRIATAPIVAGGRVFGMDALNRVTALSAANGGQVWSFDTTPASERPEAAGGGGLAYGDGRLVVTTGFGELISMDPATGGVHWRHRFDAPVSGAPAIVGGTIYVAGRDGAAWAVSAANGRVEWYRPGVRSGAAVQGGIAPAIGGGRVVMPFSSGQLLALDNGTGEPVWQGAVAGQRFGRAVSFMSDMIGDPVVSGNTVYTGTSAGRTGAFDLRTGQALWDIGEGSMNPAWPVGGSLFTVTDEGRLLRLNAQSGETIWAAPIGHYVDDRVKRQKSVHAHYGPVLAGGRLVVASSDGYLRFFAPESGALVHSIQMPSGAVSAPAVAGGTLYVATENGQVQAFR